MDPGPLDEDKADVRARSNLFLYSLVLVQGNISNFCFGGGAACGKVLEPRIERSHSVRGPLITGLHSLPNPHACIVVEGFSKAISTKDQAVLSLYSGRAQVVLRLCSRRLRVCPGDRKISLLSIPLVIKAHPSWERGNATIQIKKEHGSFNQSPDEDRRRQAKRLPQQAQPHTWLTKIVTIPNWEVT